jgi:hypothetical protein
MTYVERALKRVRFGRLTVTGKVDSKRVQVRCSCGQRESYPVRAEQLFRAARPLRNCRLCGFVAASGKAKQKSRAKVSPERRHEIAVMGGAANKKKSGFGAEVRALARAMLADGLSWREVAKAAGCSMTTLHRWRRKTLA